MAPFEFAALRARRGFAGVLRGAVSGASTGALGPRARLASCAEEDVLFFKASFDQMLVPYNTLARYFLATQIGSSQVPGALALLTALYGLATSTWTRQNRV